MLICFVSCPDGGKTSTFWPLGLFGLRQINCFAIVCFGNCADSPPEKCREDDYPASTRHYVSDTLFFKAILLYEQLFCVAAVVGCHTHSRLHNQYIDITNRLHHTKAKQEYNKKEKNTSTSLVFFWYAFSITIILLHSKFSLGRSNMKNKTTQKI